MVCHYPETAEADERIDKALLLHRRLGLPIWIFGTATARYPQSVELLLKQKLISVGIPSSAIVCSSDLAAVPPTLDTVQEATNVVALAQRHDVDTIFCVSNRLHLWQIRGLLRKEPLHLVWVSTRLRDWRWWYVLGRIVIIPFSYWGMGERFAPLRLIRWARARLSWWPI